MKISKWTLDAFDVIEKLPPRSVVLYNVELHERDVELYPLNFAGFYHTVMKKDCILIVYCVNEGSVMGAEWLIQDTGIKDSKVYGTDYVHLGFFPGLDVTIAAFCNDILSTKTVDHYGNPIANMPIFQKVKNINDIDLIITSSGGHEFLYWARMAIIPYKTLGLAFPSGAVSGMVYDQVALGIYKSAIIAQRGAAEYETLLGRPGRALATFAPLWVIYVVEVALLIIGNIAFLYHRRSKKEVS
jgi:hypothetical protein